MSDVPVTRADAIRHLYGLSLTVAGEFNASREEDDALDAETRAALHLLGVTDEDIETAYEERP